MKTVITIMLVCLASVGLSLGITAQEGKAIFQKAQAGDADAQYQLAECFAKGDGLKADPKQAKAWYQKAAAQQHELAKAALKELARLSRKGAVEIKKDVSPGVREAKGLELITLLASESNYDSVVPHKVTAPSGKQTTSKGYHKYHDNKLKPGIMKQVIELTKEGADLDLTVNISEKPYKITTKYLRPSSCSLGVAIRIRDWELIEFLLANGASHKGSTAISGFFLAYTLDTMLEKKSTEPGSPYQLALEGVQKLMDFGVDPNDCFNDSGQTMLGCAAGYNSVELAELLLKAGADINGRNSKEQCMCKNNKAAMARAYDTPIMGTHACTSKEAILLLLKYNPDLNAKGSDGKTLLDLKDDYLKEFSVHKDEGFKKMQKLADEMEAILAEKGAKRAKDL